MADPFRAEIAGVDDPQGQGRVMVRCPAMGEAWQCWAQVLRPDPAAPPPAYAPGDVVMILFEGGDPGFPIVIGTLSARHETSGADLASKLPRTDYDWHDLVLPAETRSQLDGVVAAARHEAAQRGSAVLFSGPPGTGKTMAAQIVARELGLDLFKVDLARVVSKYIGETEKNLRAVFAEAEARGAILFFDEADALFGKRSEVKDSHDRYANVEVAWLLQRLEAHQGLVILATNRRQNIDPAFMRRLTAIVSFPLPDVVCRHILWRKALAALPQGDAADIDATSLAAEHELSGGEIVQALRDACIGAARRIKAVDVDDIRDAIARLRG